MTAPPDWQPTAPAAALAARAALYRTIREFFHERGVLEVTTPVLGAHTVTDRHIDSIAVRGGGYLQTSPEYHMKRLLAAGSGSIYQMGPVFRADESGGRHNPEFTMLEWYRVGFDDRELMAEVAELVDRVLGAASYTNRSCAELSAGVTDPLPDPAWSADTAADWRLDRAIDRHPGRLFVVDYPPEHAALAQLRGTVAARFELAIDGLEIANGYLELGDADALRARFEADLTHRRSDDRPQIEIDERFLAAMAAGMPDCAGVALGVDRLLMLALGERDIRAVLAFPGERA